MSTERRLARLGAVSRTRPRTRAPAAFDYSRPSPREQLELYGLLEPLAGGRSLDALSLGQRERMLALEEKAAGRAAPGGGACVMTTINRRLDRLEIGGGGATP